MTQATEPKNAWAKAAESNPVLHFADVCLRGAGQVMFQNSAWTGLFFLLGILLQSFLKLGRIFFFLFGQFL